MVWNTSVIGWGKVERVFALNILDSLEMVTVAHLVFLSQNNKRNDKQFLMLQFNFFPQATDPDSSTLTYAITNINPPNTLNPYFKITG